MAWSTTSTRGSQSGIVLLWRDRVMRRMTFAWFVFVLGMGMGMVADAPLAEHFDEGPVGFAALIACWGSGSVIGSGLGRFLKPATEPVWLVGRIVRHRACGLRRGLRAGVRAASSCRCSRWGRPTG